MCACVYTIQTDSDDKGWKLYLVKLRMRRHDVKLSLHLKSWSRRKYKSSKLDSFHWSDHLSLLVQLTIVSSLPSTSSSLLWEELKLSIWKLVWEYSHQTWKMVWEYSLKHENWYESIISNVKTGMRVFSQSIHSSMFNISHHTPCYRTTFQSNTYWVDYSAKQCCVANNAALQNIVFANLFCSAKQVCIANNALHSRALHLSTVPLVHQCTGRPISAAIFSPYFLNVCQLFQVFVCKFYQFLSPFLNLPVVPL